MFSAYRSMQWVEANKQKEEGIFTKYKYASELGVIEYSFFKREAGIIDGVKYYDIASYRGAEGPYINSVIEGFERTMIYDFIKKFESFCKNEKIIAEFAKLDPWDRYAVDIRECYGAEYYGNYYCNDLTRDFYNKDYNRRAKRSIRKAVDSGVGIEFDFTGETIPVFVELYKNTESKFNASDYYRMTSDDIKKYFDTFKDECFLINSVYNEKIIASVLVVMGQDIVHYLYLGSNPEYLELQANSLMTYKTALYGQSIGKKLFDMGGGIPGSGIEQFKRNFISEDDVWSYYAIKKIHNVDIYNKLVNMKPNVKNSKFFPLYRG